MKSLNHYQAFEVILSSIESSTPTSRRNFSAEIVTSLAAGHKDTESLIKIASFSYDESIRLHTLWLHSVELHRDEAFFYTFLWAAVLASFIVIVIFLERHRGEP